MRERINKYLPYQIREFAMWCLVLLINTDAWVNMKENWRLICEVFLNYSINETAFKQSYSIVLSRIERITNNLNLSTAINQSRDMLSATNDAFNFNDDVENLDLDEIQLHSNEKSNKKKQSHKARTSQSSLNKSVRKKILFIYSITNQACVQKAE